MDLIKSIKCILCMFKVGKCICIVKKIITLTTFILIVCTAGKCLLDKEMDMKKIAKKLKKVM